MAKISLRAYNREIETLIDRGQIEEAIAHCKYILRFFPKHIETYRLLGKAYIESQRYSEAADILQRILSVLPDDFIAQVGMSIIREDENNLDAAIFHMEHAHEIQPSNAAVQDELRRLYGRRDGVEPPRLRLTRGALVRLYAKGDLYRQAIAEIRAALTEDPNRFDLEVVLARMYYLLGQKVEATDIASRLVSKLPFCMEANRILADILPTTARADDAKTYQARVYSLDPYLAYISTNAPTINLVPDNAVTLDHLEFQPTAAGEEQPAWAQTAGIDIGGAAEAESVPEWMTTAPGAEPAAEPVVPDATALPEPAPAVSTEMPEWMQEAGWGAAAQGVQETPKDVEEVAEPGELPDWLKEMAPTQETPAQPQESDLKLDWLDQVLPEAGTPQTRELDLTAEETAAVESTEETGTSAEVSSETEAGAQAYEETMPAWLSFPEETPAETEPVAADVEVEQPTSEFEPDIATHSIPEVEQPAAEIEPVVAEAAAEPDLEIEQPTSVIEPMAEVQSAPEEEQPAVVAGPTPETTLVSPEIEKPVAEIETFAESESVSELEQPTTAGEQLAAEVSTEIEPAAAAESITDLDHPTAEVEPIFAAETSAEIEQPSAEDKTQYVEAEPVGFEPVPESEQPVAGVESFPNTAAVELPPAEAPEQEKTKPVRVVLAPSSPEAVPAPSTQPEPQSEPDWSDLDSAMAWLEGLAAKQGADQGTLSTTAEERPETPPDWVIQEQQNAPAETPVIDQSPTPVAEAEAIQPPELEMAPSVPVTEAPSDSSTSVTEASLAEVPVAETPVVTHEPASSEGFYAEEPVAAEGPIASEPPVTADEPVSESPALASIEPLPAGLPEVPAPASSGEMDADAAFAWLESLAANQGADEATLSTSREERVVEPPTWVTEAIEPAAQAPSSAQPVTEPIANEPVSPVSQVIPDKTFDETRPTEVPAVEPPQSSIEDTKPISVGEWVQEAQPPASSEPAPKPIVAEPAKAAEPQEEPLPAWLEGLDQPPAGTAQLTPPEGMEDLPDWLKGFDTPPENAAAPASAETASVSNWLNEQEISSQEGVAPGVTTGVEQPHPPQPESIPPTPVPPAPTSSTTAVLKDFAPSQNPLIVQARSQLANSQVDPALDLYNQVIGQGQDLPAVIQDLTNAAYRFPVDAGLWQTLGDAFMRNDQIQEALDAYTKAEELLR